MNITASSLSGTASGNTYSVNFIIRDPMFLPLLIGADRNTLNNYFLSALYDVSAWIAVDLGTPRVVSAVQISQDASRAITGMVTLT